MAILKFKKILIIIASEGFQDIEYKKIREILEKAGAKIKVASSNPKESLGKYGLVVSPDISLGDVQVSNFDGIIFIGGNGASEYFEDLSAHRIIRETLSQDKILGAICIAPVVLAKAGVLGNKRATVFPSGMGDLRQAGVIYTGNFVEQDGKIITASGPQASEAFAEKIIEALK